MDKYGISDRELEEMLEERGVELDHATIKGFEAMHSLKNGQARAFQYQNGIQGEVRLVERCFNVGDCAMAEVMKTINASFPKRSQLIQFWQQRNPS